MLLKYLIKTFAGEDLYQACNSKQKYCLGLPDGCVAKANCQVLLQSSYETSTKIVSLELHSGPVEKNTYVAAAFDSNNGNMSGLVTECYTWNDKAVIDYSFNVYGAHKNEQITDQSLVKGYKNSSASYEGGKLNCRWQVDASGKATYKTETVSFDAVYIKLAAGPIKDGKKE